MPATTHSLHHTADGTAARIAAPGGGTSGFGDVVLLHGLAVSSAYFVPLLERLGRMTRTWAPDLPGHGHTTARRPLRFRELADAFEEWLDACGLQPPVLVANSYGCQLAVELLRRRPGVARGLVLIGPTCDREAATVVRQGLRLAHSMIHETAGLIATVSAEYTRCGPRRTLVEARDMVEHDLLAALRDTTEPVLVARGSRDPIAPDAWCQRVRDTRPGIELAHVVGGAHAVHHSHPGAVAALVREFASRIHG